MKITLCVGENKIECKESGSDIKAIYQISHFDLKKTEKNPPSTYLSGLTSSFLETRENSLSPLKEGVESPNYIYIYIYIYIYTLYIHTYVHMQGIF